MATISSGPAGHGNTEEPDEDNIIECKLVLLGDSGVGKTSIVQRYVHGYINEFQLATIGAAYLTKYENMGEKTVKFNLWDTAGQEKYRNLAPLYYREAQAAVVVYDITEKKSVNSAKSWITELEGQLGKGSAQIAIVGNKLDLEDERQVIASEVESWASERGFFHKEVSAMSGEGIISIFRELGGVVTAAPRRKTIILHSTDRKPKQVKKSCCK